MRRACLMVLCAAACTGGQTPAPPAPAVSVDTPVLVAQSSGTTALLQAVSAVGERVVWARGRLGTFARPTDGGVRWQSGRAPGADTLAFRDVEPVSADTAYLLSAGTGDVSRICKSVDGGRSWTLQYRTAEPEAFLDCFDFWTPTHGIAFSDAVRGQHVLLETVDGGHTWTRIPADRLDRKSVV